MTVKNYGLSGVSTQLQFGKGGAAFTFPTADGSNNQVLSTDGAGTLTWATVAGGVSPVTTKGDLYTYDTGDQRLAVGADDYVLTADSAEATGMKWAVSPGAVWTSDGSDGAVISGIGNVVVHIEADTDNVGEDDTPTLLMTQDGGTITQHALKIDGSNRFVIQNIAVTTGERGIYFQEEADAGGSTFEIAHEDNLTTLGIAKLNTNNTFTNVNTFSGTVNFDNSVSIANTTGILTIAASRFSTEWAADFRNSDIRGINGLYYNDEAQNRGEGHNWPLAGTAAYDDYLEAEWMSLRGYAGDLLWWDGVTEFKMGQEMYEGTTVRVDTTTTAGTVTVTGDLDVSGTVSTTNINSATGVNLQYNAATVAKTAADGLIVNNPSGFISVVRVGATGSDPSVALWSDSNTNTAGITQLDGSGVFDDTWIGFSEDGGVSLYYNDVKTLETTATGIITSSPTTSSLVVGTSTSTGTSELKLIQEDGGINWYCSNASASAILAQTDETGAFEKYWQINARNQGTTFYYNNNQCLETYSGGVRLGVDGATNGLIRFQSSTATGYIEQGMLSNEMVFSNSDGDKALILTGHTADIGSNSGTDTKSYNMNNSNGRVSMLMASGGDFGLYQYSNAAVIEDAWIICQRNGAVNLFHNNSKKVATTSTGIELGVNDTGGTQNIDFQTFAGATTATYDARISASAGTVNVTGDGDIDVTAKNFNVTGTIVSSNKIQCNAPSGTIPFIAKRADVTTATARIMVEFRNGAGAQVGHIDSTSTGTTYNTGSDYRLKTDVTPVASINAIATIDSLNPVTFKWHSDIITEDTPATFWGFIAHEVQAVYPQAVSGIKDEVYEEDGETIDVMQSMDYSTLTSVNTAGVKAVLELVRQQQTTINALTARIDALENP